MIRDQAIKLILARCGRRESDTYLRDQAILEMALVQTDELEGADFKPWFLLSEYMRANSGANEPRLPLPTMFLEEHEEGLLWVKPVDRTNYTPVIRGDIDDLEVEFEGAAPAMPERCGIVKNNLILYPTPDVSYQMKIRCYLKEPVLDYPFGAPAGAPETNLWLTHAALWLISATAARIFKYYLKDMAGAAELEKEAKDAKTRLYVQHVAREEMNRTRKIGDE